MKSAILALLGVTAARHHHMHHHDYVQDMESIESMSTNRLITQMGNTLTEALSLEARDDKAAAVAKTAAIKNIQKALTARILKRLDDGQPLVEVARKMKAIEGMQPQINDMERRLGIMQSVEPVLENAIKTLQKVVDVRGMGKAAAVQLADDEDDEDSNPNKLPEPIEVVRAKQAAKKQTEEKNAEAFETAREGERIMEEAAKKEEAANALALGNAH